MVYQQDNKYTAQGPKGRDGILTLDRESLAQYLVLFLVDGWAYYANRLLVPEDFENNPPVPDQYLFICRFGGFEAWNDGNPHGSASYRMNIRIPEEPSVYLLELPEIFSVYRLYINGKPVMQMGELNQNQYRPETGNRSISIEAPEAVSQLLSARLVFRNLLCAVALTVGLLPVLVGLLARRDALVILFGLLCIFFAGYASYPLIRTLFTGFRMQYVIENVSFCAMLCTTMLIAMGVSDLPKKWSVPFVVFGGMMCVGSVALHLLLRQGNLTMMMTYSRLISAYEWIAAAFIASAVFYILRKDTVHIAPLLDGAVIFVCALMVGRLLPTHEPLLTGWFIELASFARVLCIGMVTGQGVAARYWQSAIMTERATSMERLYQSQRSHFQTIKQEMEYTKTMRHDLRHHLTILDEYVQSRQFDKLREYMRQYRGTSTDQELPDYCPIDVINIITHHYHGGAKHNHMPSLPRKKYLP